MTRRLSLKVYKDAGVWRWTCTRLPCGRSDRRDRHLDALADGLVHVARHESFGFTPSRDTAVPGRCS